MNGRILVIDDDDDARASIAAHLLGGGYDVVEASDGRAGVDLLRTGAFDAVLVDIEMPVLDGYGVLEALRGEDGANASGPPVVVLTARESAEDAPRAISLGAVDLLRKPVAAAELAARVRAALALGAARRDLDARTRALEQATRTDELTGLANRRHTDEHLQMAASAARRHRRPLALLLVDVDHFRRVNDAVGHAAGDDVLRVVAQRTASVLRGDDMAGRWGGEEILVLAPSTDLDGAWRLGERIREVVGDRPIALPRGGDLVVTVSVGCATGVGDDLDDQLRRTEAALELAKAGGRNRVCTDAAAAP